MSSEASNLNKEISRYHFFVKVLIPLFLLGAVIWMSCSRISNINETFKASLSQETKYEMQDNIKNTDQIQLKNISGTNILIYGEDNRPEGLTEIKDASIKDNNFMYVLSDKSDILRIEKEGFKGFWWDIIIVSSILILIYKLFLYYSKNLITSYNDIKKQLSEFHRILYSFSGDNDDKLSLGHFKNHYDNILKEIRKIKYIGKIWWEFCETLMIKREEYVDNPNEYCKNNPIEKIKNTDQIEVYINSETIIDKQVQKEVLDVIPGILTGIGLIGTFLAIAIALMGFDMGHIELSIQNLLGGLSIKFISSLAGIMTSIMFLYIKSRLFSDIEATIFEEQHSLNSIFPRRTTESYLYHIWEEIETSNETLENLKDYAETQEERAANFVEDMGAQISTVLQNNLNEDIKEVLNELSDKISGSICGNLKETLEKLMEVMEDVKKTKEESQGKAIASVVSKIDWQEAGKGITAGIDASVDKISEQNQRVDDLVNSVGAYIEQLHSYESKVESHYKDLLENLSKALNTQVDFVDRNNEYIKNIEVASNKISSTSSNLDNISNIINEASEGFSQAASDITSIVKTSNTIVDNTRDLNNTLEQALEKFKDGTQNSTEKLFNQFGEKIAEICGKIADSVGEIEEISGNFGDLQESIETLNEILQDKQRY